MARAITPWHGARYRVGQFLAVLRARRSPLDDAPARQVLPPPLLQLFQQMPPEDRRHGLAVLQAVRAEGATLVQDAPLLHAALLHDLGKTGAGVRLIHRIVKVLTRRRIRRLWQWLASDPTGWHRPFWVLAQHPARGATWVETHGGDPDTVALIRQHGAAPPKDWVRTPLGRWLRMLQAADARN